MFETLQKPKPDKIFALAAEYKADARPERIDLGVGVYKDESGITPIMRAVSKAEQQIIGEAKTKTYVGPAGNRAFCDAVTSLVFADAIDAARVGAVQAPGGTGSLWVLLQLVKRANPNATVWISDPSWPNHWPMCHALDLETEDYPYFDPESGEVRFDEMLACLDGLGTNDVVLLHGCCHNPTGANLTPAQWDKVAASLKKTGAFALVDLAYLGFGDGLEADAYAARKLAAELPELMLAFSASKNFGLYRERAGGALCVAKDAGGASLAQANMANIVRSAYSQPPDHGAEIVARILTQPDLRAEWEAELTEMRERMLRLREKLASAIREKSNRQDFDFVARHRGMFSLLGLPKEAVDHVKAKNAVYMIEDSRINIAGIPEDKVDELASAILSATN